MTLVIVGEELRHSFNLCEYLDKKLGAIYRTGDINVVQPNAEKLASSRNALEQNTALLPVDMELKVATICGLARASSLFFRASKCTHFSE